MKKQKSLGANLDPRQQDKGDSCYSSIVIGNSVSLATS